MLDKAITIFTITGIGAAVTGGVGLAIWGTGPAPYFLAAAWLCFAVQLVSILFAMVRR